MSLTLDLTRLCFIWTYLFLLPQSANFSSIFISFRHAVSSLNGHYMSLGVAYLMWGTQWSREAAIPAAWDWRLFPDFFLILKVGLKMDLTPLCVWNHKVLECYDLGFMVITSLLLSNCWVFKCSLQSLMMPNLKKKLNFRALKV